jgi:hypothetical protein
MPLLNDVLNVLEHVEMYKMRWRQQQDNHQTPQLPTHNYSTSRVFFRLFFLFLYFLVSYLGLILQLSSTTHSIRLLADRDLFLAINNFFVRSARHPIFHNNP